MSLLDATYFDREDCRIPQGTYNTVTDSISRYERDILIQLLGYDLYKLVAAYANPGSAQRIIDLVEGKEYSIGGYSGGTYTVKWNGLLNTQKVSLLAYFVYIQYIRDRQLAFQNIGAVVNKDATSPMEMIQRAGAELRELAGYSGQDAYAPSLYNFLANNLATYPEWIFNEFQPMNAFDL